MRPSGGAADYNSLFAEAPAAAASALLALHCICILHTRSTKRLCPRPLCCWSTKRARHKLEGFAAASMHGSPNLTCHLLEHPQTRPHALSHALTHPHAHTNTPTRPPLHPRPHPRPLAQERAEHQAEADGL